MTNQSHTELAAHMALVSEYAKACNNAMSEGTVKFAEAAWLAVEASARNLASLESPERVQGGVPEHCTSGNCPCIKCPRATPPTAPAQDAELQRLQQKIDALAREAWSWSKACETESTKLYAVKKAISDAYGIVSKDQPWTPEHSKNYPKQASEIINAALTIFSATPSPQAEKLPLSEADEALMRTAAEELEFVTKLFKSAGFICEDAGVLEIITALRARLETSNV